MRMNAAPVIYRLEPHDPVGHRYRITLTVQQPDPQGQRLSLPAWIPGSYLIRDFSRQIETLSARAGTSPVAVVKTDNHSWQLAPCTGPVVIDYTVYAWDLSVRGAHLDESHGFFNGISVFLRVHGQDDQPVCWTWPRRRASPTGRSTPACRRPVRAGTALAATKLLTMMP